MNGNLSGTYISFLARCIEGARKEQEAFGELPKVMVPLKVLEEKGKVWGLPKEWVFEGAGEPIESYRKGKEAFEKEGDVYTLVTSLRSLLRHGEEMLRTRAEELRKQEEARRRKHEQAEADARRKREEEAEELRRKFEQAEADARRKREEEAEEERRKYEHLAEEMRSCKRASEEAEKALREAEKAAAEAIEKKKKEEAQIKENKEKMQSNWGVLLTLLIVYLILLFAYYSSQHRMPSPLLYCGPIAVTVIIFIHTRKAMCKMEKIGNTLDATAKATAATLKQRKGEAKKAKETLEETERRLQERTAKVQRLVMGADSRTPMITPSPRKLTKVENERMVARETKMLVLTGGATMEMVWCPPGTFLMGSPSGDPGQGNDETQHRVTLTKGFWMAKYPVTQKQWKSVMGTTVRHQRDKEDSSYRLFGEADEYPMYYVNWDEAQEFCRKVGLQLPTETQWEYACRAGSTGTYAGTGNLDEMGWYGENSGHKTHPVGTKQPNAWGLYDMHGNVWEWCQDWSGDYPNHAVTDPQGPASGAARVLRGGCWDDNAQSCRSSNRYRYRPGYRNWDFGFRPISFLSE